MQVSLMEQLLNKPPAGVCFDRDGTAHYQHTVGQPWEESFTCPVPCPHKVLQQDRFRRSLLVCQFRRGVRKLYGNAGDRRTGSEHGVFEDVLRRRSS